MGQKQYIDSLKNALVKSVSPLEKFDIQNRLLEIGYVTGDANPDSSYCIQLLSISQQLNNDSLRAIAYNQVGNYFYRNKGDHIRALEYFFKGLPYAESSGDKRRLSSLYIDIAAVYSSLNNRAEQLHYTRKAVSSLPAQTSPSYYFMAAQVQYYLAKYHLSQQQDDSAFYYTNELSETNSHLKSIIFESAIHGFTGALYYRKGDTSLADIHIAKANVLSDSSHYLFGKAEAKQAYLTYLLNKNRLPEAKLQSQLLMQLGELNTNFELRRTAAALLTTIYDRTHQTDSAYYYSRLESAMRDSVFKQDNLNKIQSLVFDEQLRNIEEEGKRMAADEQRKQNIQYALLGLGIILFIIVFLLLSRRHITNTKLIQFLGVVALLLVFEFLNLLLHPFLERITHHNPILMLLMLVLIAALLVPLHHRLEKWAIHKLVEKNKQLRLAAARRTIDELGDKN